MKPHEKTVTVYIANDGTEHTTPENALKADFMYLLTKLFTDASQAPCWSLLVDLFQEIDENMLKRLLDMQLEFEVFFNELGGAFPRPPKSRTPMPRVPRHPPMPFGYMPTDEIQPAPEEDQ